MKFRKPLLAAVLAAPLLLAACESPEKRAEAYYQSGMEYLQKGDIDRALIEFRNVFRFNGTHREARLAYANAERGRGNLREAYSQYLRLIEQYPDDPEALKALSEIAVDNAQWEDAQRFITTALAVMPNDADFQSLKIFRDYGAAVEASDATNVVAAVGAARAFEKDHPDNLRVRKIVIDDLIRAQRMDEALAELNKAIEVAPDEKMLYAQRLSVYAALDDSAAIEASLKDMIARFPDAQEIKDALTRWYISRKEYDQAEAHLRQLAAAAGKDPAAEIQLVRFLGEYRNSDAAIAELDRVIAGGNDAMVFRSARAGFLFDQGKHQEAIDDMETIVASTEAGDEQRLAKIGLAKMKVEVGDNVAARRLVEEVLAEDSGQVEAIKMKAQWLIDGDEPTEAVSLLRAAISENPRDPQLMTQLAMAYERQGDRDLMRDMLSQATDASGKAPDESLRYAQFLASENKLLPAEAVLIDALRLNPGNVGLLVPLGQLYVAMKDWPRADAVATEIEGLKQEGTAGQIADLRAQILEGQQNNSAALNYLQGLATSEGASMDAKVALIRNHLANGRNEEALAFARSMVAEDPANLDAQFVLASVKASLGDFAGAEEGFRKITEADKTREDAWLSLYRSIMVDPSRRPEANKMLEEALAAVPDGAQLLWAKAGELEVAGDIEGAIAIYEKLYAQNSGNPVIANNLSSLLSNYRKAPEDLQRASVIARRLKGSDFPPYQDTYGWIQSLTGNYTEAVPALEKAAAGLPNDPAVQYHLGMTYLAAGRPTEAAEALKKVLALVPKDDSRPFVISAKTELEKLDSTAVVE